MTDISAFLRDLAARDIRITLKGDRLQLNAPEGAVTEQLRGELASRKAEIIAFLREALDKQSDTFTLRHALRDQAIPLSFAQQRLWFLHKLNPNDPVYNLGVSTYLLGDVDPNIVQRSIEDLAVRHETLRTTFHETDGVPAQVVTDIVPTLRIVDLTHVPEEHKKAELLAFAEIEVKHPFTLSETPPVRVTLIRVAPDVSVLLFIIHHIISDGWSLGLLAKQLREIYDTYRAGQIPHPVDLPWQYADYAYSEQTWFNAADQQPHIDYWKKKLGGSPPSIDLPVDHSPGRVLGNRGATHVFTIPPQLAKQLRALSRQEGVTLFTTLLAVFKTLLYRYSGQHDIVVGTPAANRKQVELESLIGLFVSTIVLRTDLSKDPSFRELMRRVHDNVLDAHEHQDYPFEKLVDLVRPDRNLSRSPLFQTAFILHNTPLSRTYNTIGGGSIFELSLYLWDGGEDIPASFEYNADLFDASTIARMMGHFLTLAEVVVTDPNRRLSELPMLTTAERVQLLETWNDTATPYPRQQTVHALFEEQVDATPDAIALIVPGETPLGSARTPLELTYRGLDARANRFAHYLKDVGVTPGSTVGIATGRSAEFVIAVLAILKCGATYVPVDPALPADRLATMMDDANAVVLLQDNRGSTLDHRDSAPTPDTRARIIPLGATLRDVCKSTGTSVSVATSASVERTSGDCDQPDFPDTRLDIECSPLVPGYIMYTSGSTGKPKGVSIPHRAIVRLVRNTNYVTLTQNDRILACAPVSFDASTFELWGSLLNGGAIVIYPHPIPEPPEIARLVREYGITTLWLTAGLFHLMAETHPEGFKGLRQLLAGGDVLSPVYVRKALQVLDGGVLINGYGPTENTTFTCCHRMTTETNVLDSIPIGRPISNTRVYILDSSMRPAPIGVRGELWTSGDGLAHGYINDRELTESRFIPDPFSHDPACKIYRTGDIARYRADGVIEFLGRVDNQVKIRGFRVELGEIEHAIAEYPGVTDVVVVARAIGGGQKQLVAYVVAKDTVNPQNTTDTSDATTSRDRGRRGIAYGDVKRFLQQRLPDYAIPSAVVPLETFPLTPNGKVDYAALPEPVLEPRESEGPQTELEAKLLPIWEKVLGVSNIGRADNFFDIGGNSLLALQLLANIEKAIGKRVPATVLFESQTVESMALALTEELEEITSRAVPLQRGDKRPPVFIVPGVNGNVIGYEKLAQALGADQPVYGLRSVGLDGESAPLDRVETIASYFVSDVRHVQPKGPYYIVGFCMGGIIAYELARQLRAAGEDVDILVLIDTWPPVAIPDRVWTNPFGQQFVFLTKGIKRHFRAIRALPPGKRIEYLREKFGVVREMVEQRDVYRGEHTVMYSDLVKRANQHAASNYVPVPYPGSAHLFLVNDRAVAAFKEDPRLSWRQLIQGPSHVVTVEGTDSGSLLRPPFVQGLADRLRALVDASIASRTTSIAQTSASSQSSASSSSTQGLFTPGSSTPESSASGLSTSGSSSVQLDDAQSLSSPNAPRVRPRTIDASR